MELQAPKKKQRVLLVEDTGNHAIQLRRSFIHFCPGVRLDIAVDYKEALERIKEQDELDTPYDVILLDTSIHAENSPQKVTNRAEDIIYSLITNTAQVYDYRKTSFFPCEEIGPLHLKHASTPKIVLMQEVSHGQLRHDVNARIESYEPKSVLRGENCHQIETTKAWQRIGLLLGIEPQKVVFNGR